jgi:hypothetical protein
MLMKVKYSASIPFPSAMEYDNTKIRTVHFVRLPIMTQWNFNRSLNKNLFLPFFNFGALVGLSKDSESKNFVVYPRYSFGAGAYLKNWRLALLVDNHGWLLDDYKIISLSLGYRLDQFSKK